MPTNQDAQKSLAKKSRYSSQTWLGFVAIALLLAYGTIVHAQSPLTVAPSTNRVGVNNTNPGYTLDVNGTVNATSFRGDGSQLTNVAAAVLNKVTANTTVAGTAAETALYSFSVPGGTLGTNNTLRLTAEITNFATAGSDYIAFRCKYGSTSVASTWGLIANESGVAGGKLKVTCLLHGDGATDSQLGSFGVVHNGIDTTFLGSSGGYDSTSSYAQGTAAVDSTTAQNFSLAVQWYNGLATSTITLGYAILEKIQ
jgi:hypothetical protein